MKDKLCLKAAKRPLGSGLLFFRVVTCVAHYTRTSFPHHRRRLRFSLCKHYNCTPFHLTAWMSDLLTYRFFILSTIEIAKEILRKCRRLSLQT